MRSTVLTVHIIISTALVASMAVMPAMAPMAAAANNAIARQIDALPLAKIWSRTIDGPAPVVAAAGSTRLLAGWVDHLDVFAIDTGEKDWGLPIPATRAACDAMFCVVADETSIRGIDLARHAVAWQRPLEAPLGPAPTLRSGWVVLASQTGVIRALQAADGRDVWTFNAEHPLSGAPSINGNQVAIATAASTVTLLDLSTGRSLWTVTLGQLPGAPRLGGGRVLVGTENGRLAVLDALDGRLRFETRTGGNVTGAPTLDDKHFYTVGQDGVLRAFDRGNGAQRWYSNLATRAADGPYVDGGLVFAPLRTGAIDVRLNDGNTVVQLPAPGAESTRLPVPPIFAGGGSTLSLLTVSYDLNEFGKWTLARYSGGARLATSGLPAQIPGHALALLPPR